MEKNARSSELLDELLATLGKAGAAETKASCTAVNVTSQSHGTWLLKPDATKHSCSDNSCSALDVVIVAEELVPILLHG